VRALLLGDSYAEALQVARRANFSSVAERRLPGLEVVNAGLSGRTPLDYPDWLREFGPRLEPDVVIVQVNEGDLVGLTRPANFARLARPRPGGAPAPPPRESGPARLARRVLRSSALVTALWQRAKLVDVEWKLHPPRPFRAPARGRPARSVDVLADPLLPAMLDSLHRRLAADSPRLVYLYLPIVDYHGPRPAYGDPRGAAVWHAFAARNHATLVDMFEPFAAEFERTGQPLHGFPNSVVGTGHINAAGHRVTGERLARAVAEAMR
jgi:lysophospholipase L1-like esterase